MKSTTCNQPYPVQCTRHPLSPSVPLFLPHSVSLSCSPALAHCLQLPPANLFEKPFVTFGLVLFTLNVPPLHDPYTPRNTRVCVCLCIRKIYTRFPICYTNRVCVLCRHNSFGIFALHSFSLCVLQYYR